MIFHKKLIQISAWKHLMKQCHSSKEVNKTSVLVQCLDNRSLLRVSGDEVETFLQGLITNDIRHLDEGASSMYSMFLNSRGRVLYDTILYKTNTPKSLLLECDTSSLEPLKKHLSMYRVRKKIGIDSLEDEFKIWTACHEDILKKEPLECYNKKESAILTLFENFKLQNVQVSNDPRVSLLGLRIIAPKDFNLIDELEKLPNINVKAEKFYKMLRYKLGVGEGESDLPPGNCFPLETNCDYLHGVSFHKGCYVGQELTARTQHTGVVRKRLMPLIFEEKLDYLEPDTTVLGETEKSLGKLRGTEENVGLGLLRIEEVLKLSTLKVADKVARTFRPCWWPSEAPKERVKAGQSH